MRAIPQRLRRAAGRAARTVRSGPVPPPGLAGPGGGAGQGRPGQRHGPGSVLSLRSVVGQMFVLQAVVVVLVVSAAAVALVLQSRHNAREQAADRTLAVAEAFSEAPGVDEALRSRDPTAVLQPRAEAVRRASDVDVVAVLDEEGIIYAHPDPAYIGRPETGSIAPALRGRVVQDIADTSAGRSMRSIVPVRAADGEVIGLVGAAVTLEKIHIEVASHLPVVLGPAVAAVLLTTGGVALVSRRLLRQTHGLGPSEITRMYEHHDAVLHSVREGILITDEEQRLLLANDEARRLLDLPQDAEGRLIAGTGLDEETTALLSSRRDATDRVHPVRGRLLAVNHRAMDSPGGPRGTVTTLRDSTELRVLSRRAEVTRKRLELLYEASVSIGTTLEVTRTAEELTEVAVPGFADYLTVDLAEPVLRGEEPAPGDTRMFRTATAGIREDHPLHATGSRVRFGSDTPQVRGLAAGRGVIEPALRDAPEWRAQDPERTARILEHGIHSLITAPLHARGVVLGVANFWRARKPEPFDEDDLSLAEELVARTAVCIDNARRFTREHAMAVALQRSLLPRGLPEQNALEAAYRYLPAQAGVGGDWFDVIPVPGARVALVVGDVVGHGLHAAATMGRLRTAVHNFSALDLPPGELLGHLNELADRIDRDETPPGGIGAITGATCLYAVYDPVEGLCTAARAGHLPPAVVHADGRVELAGLPAGPPLGVMGRPFETAELRLAEGSMLVLYTDGLVESRGRDIDEGLELLCDALLPPPGAHGPGRTPEESCDAVLDALLPARPGDDVAVLAARTRVLEPGRIAVWEVPADPAAVSGVRAAATERLAAWGLDDVAFITELIVSELLTNALRHADGPVRVRLLHDRALICEVADSSSTSPHLRNAATTDEGGRGLFLVSQYADRWGTRYTEHGKVIWTEQRLPAGQRREPPAPGAAEPAD